jgi:glycosyltransferase involved in cell wall biosynthesis
MHVITTLDVGGAECMLLKLVSHANPGFQHKVIYLKGGGSLVSQFGQYIQAPVCLNLNRMITIPYAAKILKNEINAYQPDILQTWLYHADLCGLMAGKLARIPIILWNVRCSYIDFSEYALSSKLVFKLVAHFSSKPTGIIFNSVNGLRIHRQAGYRPKYSQVIPNGFDTRKFRPDPWIRKSGRCQLGIRADAPVIGMVARYDPIKRHTVFIKAARLLSDKISNAQFVLVGKGIHRSNRNLFEQIMAAGLEDRFHLLGNRSDLQRIYPILDIHALTSYSEGFPNVIGEAMACGVPCVATDVGDTKNIIGATGVLVPVGRPELLSKAWMDVLALSDFERMELGKAARNKVTDDYNIVKIVERYESFYQGML